MNYCSKFPGCGCTSSMITCPLIASNTPIRMHENDPIDYGIKKSKIVYIAHPISGNIEKNLKDIIRILRIINTNSHHKNPKRLDEIVEMWHKDVNGMDTLSQAMSLCEDDYKLWIKDPFIFENFDFQDIIPLAPYYADILALDDNNPEERARGIANDVALIKSGVFQELWLTGERISFGMEQEIKLFTELGLPTINYIGKI